MDWKKKYEEALSKARAEYENARKQGYTWLMGLLEGMFPDLKESEDEKATDIIFDCTFHCCDTDFISQEQRDKVLAWLEKQKESLHISETCKENADSFTDEDEKMLKRIRLCLDECVHSDIIRDYERDECVAYLEK